MSIAVSSGAHAGVVPVLRYRNVEEAVSWLSRAFGFEESRFVKDAEGKARYAQLAWGGSMIMLCPLGGSAFDACMAQPSETGGCETQIAYVYVDDVEAHKARATAAGAEIVLDMIGGDGRGQGYSCRDIEGHIWSFGTYDPWRHVTPRPEDAAVAPGRRVASLGLMGLLVAAALTVGYMHFTPAQGRPSATLANINAVLEKPTDLESAEKLLRQTREELMRERAQRMLAERTAQETKDAGTREREARVEAEKSAADARKALAEKNQLLAKAEKSVDERSVANASIVAVSAAPQALQGIQAAKACDADAEARALRTASLATSAANDEIAALKVAVERAQSELAQERQRAQRVSGGADLRGELERERTARERAERQVRETLARLARLEGHRKPQDVPVPVKQDPGYYKDLTPEIFPLPGTQRY